MQFHHPLLDTCGNQLGHEGTQAIVFANQQVISSNGKTDMTLNEGKLGQVAH